MPPPSSRHFTTSLNKFLSHFCLCNMDMAMRSLLSFSLCFLVMFHCCFARQQQEGQFRDERGRSPCQLNNLNALEPNRRIKSEAGVTDVWDDNNQQLQCAGVSVVRHDIEPRGLLLPSYTNAPQLMYILQGTGIQGTLIPGCAETYESTEESQQGQGQGQGQRYRDQHQKIRGFREGSVLAMPAGVAQWVYNSGDKRLVVVVLLDTSNNANQLDQNPRRFYLAGNPEQEHRQQGQEEEKRERNGNVLRGLDTRLLAEAFGVSTETAKRLQSTEDNRGNIVKVEEGLQVVRPPRMIEEQAEKQREREQQGGERGNGLEETICSLRLGENIDDPSRADVYNPQAGRVSSLNSLNLPVLGWLRLSAERGVLYRNAVLAPHYNLNAHSVTYVTRGRARVQVVDNSGRTVFNEELRQGQVLVQPQNYVVVKQASNEGFEYVSFKTNNNAMIAPLAGRTSVLRALPEEVVANAYQISREEARRLKYSREETTVFTSRGQRRASA